MLSLSGVQEAGRTATADDIPLCHADFDFGKVLGTGSFGRVCLAVHKDKGFVCAIKALSKAHIIKNQQARPPRLITML